MSAPRNNTESNEPRSAETLNPTQPRDKQLEQPKTRNFDDYQAAMYAKHPGLELEVEIAGILIDVQMDYYKRIKKGQDTVGGFEKQQQQIKALIAQASHTAVVEALEQLKDDKLVGRFDMGNGLTIMEAVPVDCIDAAIAELNKGNL